MVGKALFGVLFPFIMDYNRLSFYLYRFPQLTKFEKTKVMEWIKSDVQSHLKNAFWVEIIAEIKHNKTGEIVVFEDESIMNENEEHPDTWIWREGNYSCDCNRRLFFKRAKGEETKEDWDVPCSDGKYSVNLKNKKDGRIYYQEFEK